MDSAAAVKHTPGPCMEEVIAVNHDEALVAALQERLEAAEALIRRFSQMANTYEVLGEWSALDMNPIASRKERTRTDAFEAEVRAFLESGGTDD